jgi:O-antigen ligase
MRPLPLVAPDSVHIAQSTPIFRFLEKWFTIAAMLFFMSAVLELIRDPGHNTSDPAASSGFGLVTQFAMYGPALLLVVLNSRHIYAALRGNILICTLLAMLLLSTSWSAIPFFTFRRAMAIIVISTFGMYFGTRYSIQQQARMIATALGIALALSAVFIVALPTYGVDVRWNAGAWRGVFIQKNVFARNVVLAILTWLCLKPRGGVRLAIKCSGLFLAGILLAGSQSVGSYFSALVLVPASSIYGVIRRHRNLLKAMMLAGITGLVFLATLGRVYLLAAIASAGRNWTLTGRLPLWSVLRFRISQRPWLGFGFSAFWPTEGWSVWTIIGWTPSKAHNGYLDLLLDVGLVGLAVFVLSTTVVLFRAIKVARLGPPEIRWPVVIIGAMLFYNFFETDLLQHNCLSWVLYCAIAASVHRALQARKGVITIQAVTAPPLDLSNGWPPNPYGGARACGSNATRRTTSSTDFCSDESH